MFAIVRIGSKQYKVEPDQTLEVDRLEGKVGDTVKLGEVLLISDEKDTHVGTPVVKRSVLAKILSQDKGEKIHVRRFKAKSRYRRARGFRPLTTKLTIVSIGKS